jgi:hypothetical protein
MINPYAYFDCLGICAKAKKILNSVSLSEICLLAYLGCLLSIYKKEPVSNWGYMFIATVNGTPFSYDICKVLPYLSSNGCLKEEESGFFKILDGGLEEYEILRTFSQNSWKECYLEGACSILLALPIGVIRQALYREPELKKVKGLSTSRFLLEGSSLDNIYEQFSVLSTAIGLDVKDLMVPAVVWLTYLFEEAKRDFEK